MSNLVGSDRESHYGESFRIGADSKKCRCGISVGRWKSWTIRNPARRFIECKNFQDPNKYCNFSVWIDPEILEYYKAVIIELKEKAEKKELDNSDDQRMSLRALKLMERDNETKRLKSEVQAARVVILQSEEENAKLKNKYAIARKNVTDMECYMQRAKDGEQCMMFVLFYPGDCPCSHVFVSEIPHIWKAKNATMVVERNL